MRDQVELFIQYYNISCEESYYFLFSKELRNSME